MISSQNVIPSPPPLPLPPAHPGTHAPPTEYTPDLGPSANVFFCPCAFFLQSLRAANLYESPISVPLCFSPSTKMLSIFILRWKKIRAYN